MIRFYYLFFFLIISVPAFSQYVCNDCDFPVKFTRQEILVDDACNFSIFFSAGDCDDQCFIRLDSIIIPENYCIGVRPQDLMYKASKKILENWLNTTSCLLTQDTMKIVNLFKPLCFKIIGPPRTIIPCKNTGCCMTEYYCMRRKPEDKWTVINNFVLTDGKCTDSEESTNCHYSCE
jgi:hypothetical protein